MKLLLKDIFFTILISINKVQIKVINKIIMEK